VNPALLRTAASAHYVRTMLACASASSIFARRLFYLSRSCALLLLLLLLLLSLSY
jgi:hypothetical protein